MRYTLEPERNQIHIFCPERHMKKLFILHILLLFVIFSLISCVPNPKDILEGSYKKCQSVKNGFYEMEHYWKLMSRNDTIKVIQSCYFKKTENDSILPFVFNAHFYSQSSELRDVNLLYTGKEVVLYAEDGNKTGTIVTQPDDIWNIVVKNIIFNSYLPITYDDSRPVKHDLFSASDKVSIQFIKEEQINGLQCYHIQAIVPQEYDHSVLKNSGYLIKTEFNYWINKHDSIPVQITINRDLKIGNESLIEFEKYILTKYELNKDIDSMLFTMQSVPNDIDLHYLKPLAIEKKLKVGDVAPNWNLVSTKGEKFALSDFKGDLVLIDFFYASCPPCVQVLPVLNSLYKKYKDQGLHVVGISNNDTQKTLESFIDRHGIYYPLLFGNHDVNSAYNISNVPATYLIDKEGKILFQHIGGYNKSTIEKLDHIIRQHVR